MTIRKVIHERIRRSSGGANVDSDVHTVIAANVGERGKATHVSSTQRPTADSTSSEDKRNGSNPA
ncbi:MAG TPA: hypothetical protein VM049_02465 [Gaiellaceae bacterium]|nr:hypothetical protein [Gaiellaceae bacterium]